MKKITLLFMFFAGCIAYAQSLVLNPEGLVSSEDQTKNYVILEFPGKTQSELFKAAKLYVNTRYNNPKFVTSEVENEQVVINAVAKDRVRIMGLARFDINYNAAMSFKDGKLRLQLTIKDFERYLASTGLERLNVIGIDMGISKTGIYNAKGKVISAKGKQETEEFANSFVTDLKAGIEKQSSNSDW